MNDILDDFVDAEAWESPRVYYQTYAVFLVLLITLAAYLNNNNVVEVTPAFETYPGQLVSTLFLFSTVYCCKRAARLSWIAAAIVGILVLLVCFTIALQSVIGITSFMHPASIFIWIAVVVIYVGISIGIIHLIRYWRKKQAA